MKPKSEIRNVVADWITKRSPEARSNVVGNHLDELRLIAPGDAPHSILEVAVAAFEAGASQLKSSTEESLALSLVVTLHSRDTLPDTPGSIHLASRYKDQIDLGRPPELYLYPRRFKITPEVTEEYKLPISAPIENKEIANYTNGYCRYWRFESDVHDREPYQSALYFDYLGVEPIRF